MILNPALQEKSPFATPLAAPGRAPASGQFTRCTRRIAAPSCSFGRAVTNPLHLAVRLLTALARKAHTVPIPFQKCVLSERRCAFLSLKPTRLWRNSSRPGYSTNTLQCSLSFRTDQSLKLGDKIPIDLILLDLNLPGVGGPDYLRQLQNRWPETPVVLLAIRPLPSRSASKGSTPGADDIITKPFAWLELGARIRAVLRRRNRPAREVFQFEDLEVNRVSHQVRRAGPAIELSPKEYALLEFLLRNPGRPVTRAAIIEEVWRIHGDSITNVVDVYINYLRRKIDAGADRPLIRTIRGVGYQIGGNHRAS